MTIDEVIAIAKEKADKNSECWKHCTSCDDCDLCEEYHKQLAEWLEELVDYRRFNGAKTFDNGFKQGEKYGYNKAIDEFAKELKSTLPIAVHRDCSEIDYEVDCALYNFRLKIDEITEQVKTERVGYEKEL